jgi:hypothetical protein
VLFLETFEIEDLKIGTETENETEDETEDETENENENEKGR